LSLRLIRPTHVYVVTYLSHVSRCICMDGVYLRPMLQLNCPISIAHPPSPSKTMSQGAPCRVMALSQHLVCTEGLGGHNRVDLLLSPPSSTWQRLDRLSLTVYFFFLPLTAVTGEKVSNHGILFSTSQARPLASRVSSMSSECKKIPGPTTYLCCGYLYVTHPPRHT
jgi:hypothetical protein